MNVFTSFMSREEEKEKRKMFSTLPLPPPAASPSPPPCEAGQQRKQEIREEAVIQESEDGARPGTQWWGREKGLESGCSRREKQQDRV